MRDDKQKKHENYTACKDLIGLLIGLLIVLFYFSEYKECNVGNLEYLRVGLTNGFASSFRSPARAGSIGHQPHTPVSTDTFKYKDDAEIL